MIDWCNWPTHDFRMSADGRLLKYDEWDTWHDAGPLNVLGWRYHRRRLIMGQELQHPL